MTAPGSAGAAPAHSPRGTTMARILVHAPDGGIFRRALCENPEGDVTDYEQDVDCSDCLDTLEEAEPDLRSRMRAHQSAMAG